MLKLPLLSAAPKPAPAKIQFKDLPVGAVFMYSNELTPSLGDDSLAKGDFGSVFIKLNGKTTQNCVKFERINGGFDTPTIVSFHLTSFRYFFKVDLVPWVSPVPNTVPEFAA